MENWIMIGRSITDLFGWYKGLIRKTVFIKNQVILTIQ